MSNNQEYIDLLTGGIGRVLLSTTVSDAFPLVGDTVRLEAATKWAQKTYFTIRSEPGNPIEEIIENTSQRESTIIPITSVGELKQEIRAVNYRNGEELFSASMLRNIYAMERQTLPYHDVAVSSEVNRTDQNFTLKLSGDNGYDLSRECDLSVHILTENGSASSANEILITLSRESFTLSDGVLVSSPLNIPTRGIYDVETRYKDIATGETIRKRINKLITVTPRLAATPTEGQLPFGTIDSGMAEVDIKMYKTGVNDLYMEFAIPNTDYPPEINMSKVPSGYDAYTLVLTKPTVEDDNVISRVRLTCDIINGNPSQSPTPQFTREHPLVITHNGNAPLELHGATWNTMSIAGIRNLVVDGRGYANLEKGLKFNANPVTGEKPIIAIQFSGGSSDMELFEVEVTGTAFTAIMAKTDPAENTPWWWYGNFAQDNFHMHHFYIHDTDGEGCYLGYFTPGETSVVYTGETVSFMNLKNEYVTYTKGNTYRKKAHYLTNFRFYRNVFERTGYDGVQISNSIGEVCYNVVSGCAHAEEVSQTSGMSIQSLNGKCYNNLLLDNRGPSMQIGPIGDLEIYNNIAHSKFGAAIQFLFNYDVPEQNPTRQPEGSLVVNSDIRILIHNNVFATPGLTANGRNTVQIRNVHFVDNIIANDGTLVSNMTGDTLNVWQSQAIGNNISLYKDLYLTSIENKIANYTGGDYRISFNSPLINAGTGIYFKNDHRGYLNWFGSVAPVGAFMGKYKNPLATQGSSMFDPETGITKFLSQNAPTIGRTIYDTIGETFGTARPSSATINMYTTPNIKGAITGNNTGVYPDIYLEHNSVFGGNKAGTEHILFTIPAGMYRVRFLANTISNSAVIQSQSDYKIITNAGEIPVSLPVSGIKNNTSVLTEWVTVPVAENDILTVVFGLLGLNGAYYHAAMNVIEIEEM